MFMCIRQEWDIRGSQVQAFATFLILSYVKISFDLLTPVYLKTVDGGTLYQTYLFNAGDLMYFGSERSVHADSLQHHAYCAAISDVIR